MMFFVYHIHSYFPKNLACKELCEYIERYKHRVIKNKVSLEVIKNNIHSKVEQLNTEYSKLKPIQISGMSFYGYTRIEASVNRRGLANMVFTMDICKTRSIRKVPKGNNMQIQKGGEI